MISYIDSLKVVCEFLQNSPSLLQNRKAYYQRKTSNPFSTSRYKKGFIGMAGFIRSIRQTLSKKCIILRRLSSKRNRARYNSEVRAILVSPIDPPRLELPEISGILIQAPRNWHDEVSRYLGRHCDCCSGEQMVTEEPDALDLFIWDDDFEDAELEVEMLYQGVDLRRSWSPLYNGGGVSRNLH